jgi:phosphohistidine phosphatase
MKLWIMRHGEAESLNVNGSNDRQRALTARGHAQTQASGAWLAARGLAGVPVIASPYRRAQQTAAGVLAAIHSTVSETLELLEPGGDPRRVVAWLADRHEPALILVSHMPLVGQLVSWLEDGVLAAGPAFSVAQVNALDMAVVGAGQAHRTGVYIPDWQGL